MASRGTAFAILPSPNSVLMVELQNRFIKHKISNVIWMFKSHENDALFFNLLMSKYN